MYRWKLQFGELSRAPMKLLKFHLQGELAECDWVARSHDPWDASLPPQIRRRHASEQALNDAMAVRELLFRALPELQTAAFRIYREMTNADPELVIAGIVDRGDEVANVPSPAMRARLCGLRFWLEDGILGVLGPEEAVLRDRHPAAVQRRRHELRPRLAQLRADQLDQHGVRAGRAEGRRARRSRTTWTGSASTARRRSTCRPTSSASSGVRYPGHRGYLPLPAGADVGRVGIGEGGLEATPLQMAMVAAAVANGGRLMTPAPDERDRQRRRPGRRRRIAPTLYSTVMKPSTAQDGRADDGERRQGRHRHRRGARRHHASPARPAPRRTAPTSRCRPASSTRSGSSPTRPSRTRRSRRRDARRTRTASAARSRRRSRKSVLEALLGSRA